MSLALPVIGVCATPSLGEEALAAGAAEWHPEDADPTVLLESIHLMANLRMVRSQPGRSASHRSTPPRPDGSLSPQGSSPMPTGAPGPPAPGELEAEHQRVALVGGSTGAPGAVLDLLGAIDVPLAAPLVFVQHMPADYSATFVDWLRATAQRDAELVRSGTALQAGLIHVVPADHHATLDARGRFLLHPAGAQGPVPSIDRLFQSVAERHRWDRFAVLLTGMGRDGAEGLLALRRSGARTFAQDEASSTVFGMPQAAAKLGAAQALLAPDAIGRRLADWLSLANV
jgi:two-component system chemotaxis response regulator CheB